MGKPSVSQPYVAPPGNGTGASASREVFQGLFKDLGKQAMALEAILRAVCGRVDKVENWLTEVSYGMTELDLKLRNIAHNIDGAAAVDEESHGARRWAIPPADDTTPTAPTVSKKFGSDKKAVRVTGMAAGILERLSAVEERAPVASASVEDRGKPEKTEKAGAKKKKKHDTETPKKHHAKKPKIGAEAVAAAAAADTIRVGDNVSVEEIQPPLPTAEAADDAPASKAGEADSPAAPAALEEITPTPETPVVAPTPEPTSERENTRQDDSQQDDETPAAEVEMQDPVEPATQAPVEENAPEDPLQANEESVYEPSGNDNETPPEVDAPKAPQEANMEPEAPDTSLSEMVLTSARSSHHSEEEEPPVPQEVDHITDQSGASSAETSPAVSARDQIDSNESKEALPETREELQAVKDEEASMASESNASSPRDQQELEEVSMVQEASPDPVVAAPEVTSAHSAVGKVDDPIETATPLPAAVPEHVEVVQAEPSVVEVILKDEAGVSPVPAVVEEISQPTPAIPTENKPELIAPRSSPAVQVEPSTIKAPKTVAATVPPAETATVAAASVPAVEAIKPVAAVASKPKPAPPVASPAEAVKVVSLEPEQPAEVPRPANKVTKTVEPPLRQKVAAPAPVKPASAEISPLAVDPLMSKSRRSSSKKLSKSSNGSTKKVDADNTPQSRRSSANKRSSESRHASSSSGAGKQLKSKSKQELTAPEIPTPPVATTPATKNVGVNDVESDNSSSGRSGSSSNEDEEGEEEESDGGESDDGNEDEDEDDDEDSEGEQDEDQKDEEEDEEPAVGESMSRTITALKKLKKANMLTPEEEEELKQRAHKKWFQLKGHIKEKQKKDVANILLKRKKNVFTVSSRIELLEEKSRELYQSLKQITNELHDKADGVAHEALRRHAHDIEQSLQALDARLASLSSPALEKVDELQFEVGELRSAVQFQLSAAHEDATVRHAQLEAALAEQRLLVETMAQDLPTQLRAQAELFAEQLKQLPDHSAALESLRRSMRRKADLKLLKELEARLLGLDAENEDCLVRCLSCRKEVLNVHGDAEAVQADDQQDVSGGGQLRKVNPGPSAPRIYRSSVPFSAQPFIQEAILEETSADDPPALQQQQQLVPFEHPSSPIAQHPQPQPQVQQSPPAVQQPPPEQQRRQQQQQQQSAGDSRMSERSPAVRAPPVARWSTPAAEAASTLKRDSKTPRVAPISLMNITATRATLSPDRPISAPVVVPKKKPVTPVRAKSQRKPRPGMLQEPPQ